jgi:hypothetical protein
MYGEIEVWFHALTWEVDVGEWSASDHGGRGWARAGLEENLSSLSGIGSSSSTVQPVARPVHIPIHLFQLRENAGYD